MQILTQVFCLSCMLTAAFPLVSEQSTPSGAFLTSSNAVDAIPAGTLREHPRGVAPFRTLPPLRVITSQPDTPPSASLQRRLLT